MTAKILIDCACGCGKSKSVRVADVNRGWGKFYSKSCKARSQYKSIGAPRFFDKNERHQTHHFSSEGLGQDGYGM